MLAMKAIKPKRLNDTAMRLELLNQMRKTGNAIKKDFEKTTATWEHKPKFEVVISLTGPGPVVLVATDDQIYRFVDEGTKPHLIFAGFYTGKSKKKALAFPGTFSAKTVPGVIGSGPGSRGGDMVHTPYVQHPGTKARNFDEAIARDWQAKFKRDMEGAMRRAAAKSGHGI
jgi:hypothetical protein